MVCSISIHAPSRGRPQDTIGKFRLAPFQSTPPRGGDKQMQETLQHHHNFNPRPLAGATKTPLWVVFPDWISIHAPSRGRQLTQAQELSLRLFQSTPPRGGDGFNGHKRRTGKHFNPRPLAGATNGATGGEANVTLFQSTPPRGGDVWSKPAILEFLDFNPRPLAGATSCNPSS